jgi:hypothetical protein
MTPADLVERVAKAICKADGGDWSDNKEAGKMLYRHEATAAIAIALEEAARVAENHREPNPFPTRQRAIAAAIRAMMEKEKRT